MKARRHHAHYEKGCISGARPCSGCKMCLHQPRGRTGSNEAAVRGQQSISRSTKAVQQSKGDESRD